MATAGSMMHILNSGVRNYAEGKAGKTKKFLVLLCAFIGCPCRRCGVNEQLSCTQQVIISSVMGMAKSGPVPAHPEKYKSLGIWKS